MDSAKVSAPTASGSSTSHLIKTKSAEPPPKGGFSAEGKRGMDISTEEGSATGSAEGKIAANDGRGGKSELGGKASAKIDKSGNIDLSLGANQTDLDEKGKGTARSGQATFKRDAEKGQTVVGLSGQQTTSDAEGTEKKVSGGISTSGVHGGYTRTEHIGESLGKSLSGTGAVDWNNKGDTFHNEWQTYRTRKDNTLSLETSHVYSEPGEYTVVVKVIDILGNDTTKTVKVKVR